MLLLLLFIAPENGWDIHWLLFKFPNYLLRGTIVVYELIISLWEYYYKILGLFSQF